MILLFLIFLNVTTIAAKTGEIKKLTQNLSTMEDKFKPLSTGVHEKEYAALLGKIDFANAIIDKKKYNWLDLLDKLEKVVPEGIAISSVDPDLKGQSLKLSGVGRNFMKLRVFMEKLEESTYFTDVYLTSQSSVRLSDDMQGVTFNITCRVVDK
jgi:type IV pilus assembly protein PilN